MSVNRVAAGLAACWKPWAILGAVIVVGVIVTLDARADEAAERERAKQAEQVAEREAILADSLARVADSAKRERDTFRDSTRALTEELERTERELARARRDTEAGTVAAGDSLEATLAELEAAVPPELLPVVQTARRQQADQRASIREERRIFDRQLAAKDSLLRLARSERDSWKADWEDEHRARLQVARALEEQKDATEKWKDAADESVLEALLGRTIWEGAGTVASGALAYVAGTEKGLIGWGIAKGGDLVLSGR